ncbi:MAG TPA: conjugal transfer protein TrbC [Paraburkholderia sp.]|uniref:conjugal transfer protein TrbC n=1 Tax=Paraburkholderia sp. TaxID=1926495 RepID=UPI002B46CBD6|nr:conjugal transfer protein TrbC [Paraburkholderia sp.]HKR40043.1 conjugal transfer protein TrbC [Paraburkholderia sp.]
MKKHLMSRLQLASSAVRRTCRRLFARAELRSTLIAAGLSVIAPVASATDLSDLGSATDVICLVSSWISGPWLFGIGLVIIIVAFIAIATSESTIAKVLSTALAGIGFAACAVPILKNHFKISYVCT